MEMGKAKLRMDYILQAFVEHCREAEEHRVEERAATVKIQSAWRKHLVLSMVRRWSTAATNIQRVFRGHLGRVAALYLQLETEHNLRMAYFNHKASIIQKVFRGYLCRKYTHSFYARQGFLQSALANAVMVQQELIKSFEMQCSLRHTNALNRAEEAINKFIAHNHFNVSTKCRNGIFYSPYLAVLGKPNQVEDEIRRIRKEQDCVHEMNQLRKIRGETNKLTCLCVNPVTRVGAYVTAVEIKREQIKEMALMQINEDKFQNILPNRSFPYSGATLRTSLPYGETERINKEMERQVETGYSKLHKKRFIVALPHSRCFCCHADI